MSFSHSKVETHHTCPYKYKLRYVDKLEPKPDLRPSNALYIGTAVHEGYVCIDSSDSFGHRIKLWKRDPDYNPE